MKFFIFAALFASMVVGHVDYWVGLMRGMWSGYHRQFYHSNQPLDKKCFNEESSEEIEQILDFVIYGHFYEILQVAD